MSAISPIDIDIQAARAAMGEVDVLRGVRYLKAGRAGYEHMVEHRVARTLEEAQTNGWDYFDTGLMTWIIQGYKPEKEYRTNTDPNGPPVGRPYVPPPPDEEVKK